MADIPYNRVWQPYIDTAISAWKKGDKLRAEKIVSLLVQVLQQSQNYDKLDKSLVSGLYCIAENFCLEREYWRAEWIYLNVLEIQEDVLGPDHADTCHTLKLLNMLIQTSDLPQPQSHQGENKGNQGGSPRNILRT